MGVWKIWIVNMWRQTCIIMMRAALMLISTLVTSWHLLIVLCWLFRFYISLLTCNKICWIKLWNLYEQVKCFVLSLGLKNLRSYMLKIFSPWWYWNYACRAIAGKPTATWAKALCFRPRCLIWAEHSSGVALHICRHPGPGDPVSPKITIAFLTLISALVHIFTHRFIY